MRGRQMPRDDSAATVPAKKDQVARISLLFPGMLPICTTFADFRHFSFWLREIVTIDPHLPEIAAESS